MLFRLACFAIRLDLAWQETADVCTALQQYWIGSGTWRYVPVATFAEAFQKHKTGLKSAADLSVPFDKSASTKDSLVNQKFSLSSKPFGNTEWDVHCCCIVKLHCCLKGVLIE